MVVVGRQLCGADNGVGLLLLEQSNVWRFGVPIDLLQGDEGRGSDWMVALVIGDL